ncbi:AAA-ATPase [Camellia lanceoleosa]|uniref:AAA-ATPase n=1 Tax=Camellia lanceoleosa TaxID=1840588 RepID=A0ACC0IKH8_9ERIC|nr:AAA-ATPase [Camellia lanceoleosa]
MFETSKIYLRSKINSLIRRLNISKEPGEEDICVSIKEGEKIMDTFQGIQLTWQMMNRSPERYPPTHRSIELRFNQKYKEKVLRHYLPHVLERSKAMKAENKVLKLYSYGRQKWSSVNLDHPSTFETLAMDPRLKKERWMTWTVCEEKKLLPTIGKAWKRAHKGSPNSEFRNLLVSTANQSILVIEDIDCSKKIHNRQNEEYNNVCMPPMFGMKIQQVSL